MHESEACFLNSHNLYGIAVAAVGRLASANSDRLPGQDDALVAVVFSACTLEALIHEIALVARNLSAFIDVPTCLIHLADAIEETEASRGSTRLKFQIARSVLPNVAFDKGKEPYQSFDHLFSLRDALAHVKPSPLDINESRRLVRALQSRALCDVPDDSMRNWVSEIATRSVAIWACNVVVDVAETFARGLSTLKFPPGELYFGQILGRLPRLRPGA